MSTSTSTSASELPSSSSLKPSTTMYSRCSSWAFQSWASTSSAPRSGSESAIIVKVTSSSEVTPGRKISWRIPSRKNLYGSGDSSVNSVCPSSEKFCCSTFTESGPCLSVNAPIAAWAVWRNSGKRASLWRYIPICLIALSRWKAKLRASSTFSTLTGSSIGSRAGGRSAFAAEVGAVAMRGSGDADRARAPESDSSPPRALGSPPPGCPPVGWPQANGCTSTFTRAGAGAARPDVYAFGSGLPCTPPWPRTAA